tara:strand:+ start:491 stop:1273 length:783 start_codon:yes stop_codon:yes gene_type:complete
MNLGLNNKCALVTAASTGIGKAIAYKLSKEGCDVAICARDEKKLDKAIKEMNHSNSIVAKIVMDMDEKESFDFIIDEMISNFGKIDILVNNFGGGGKQIDDKIENISDEVWEKTYHQNAFSASKLTMLSLPYMIKNNWGRVITIASINGREGGGRPWYTMSKSAQISLMKTLSMKKEYSKYNITFNSIAPGAINTPGSQWEKIEKENPKKLKELISWKHPLGRLGTAEEIADVVAFVSSAKSSLLNGACIPLDGGESKSY